MPPNTSKRSTLIVATLTSFATPFMMSAVGIALPDIQRDLSVDAVLLSWVATSYILASAVFLVPFGRLADIYGRRKIFTFGLGLFTVTSFAAAFAWSVTALIAIRVLQGLGGAMIMTTAIAILTSVFPASERGKVLGINTAAVYTGLSAGPFVGGFLVQQLGWRAVFWVPAPLGVIAFVMALTLLRDEWADAKGDRFDLTGSVLYGLSLVAILYGASTLPEISGIALMAVGLILGVVFVRHESGITSPVLNIGLFRNNRGFSLSNLAAFIHYAATFGVTFLLSLYLQYIKGLSPQQAGLVLLFQPVLQSIFAPFAGWLSDRIEPRIIASIGMAITSTGLLIMVFIGEDTPTAFIAATLAFMGSGYGLFTSPNTNAIMSSVEKQYYGIASGAVSTMRNVGMSVSMAIVTILFALMIGRTEIMPENYPEFSQAVKLALGIFAGICAVGIIPSLARGNIRE